MILSLFSCGGGGGGGASDDTKIIDSKGGTIELSNGARLEIPPGSATEKSQVLFKKSDIPEFLGDEEVIAYKFITNNELAESYFFIPVEFADISNM